MAKAQYPKWLTDDGLSKLTKWAQDGLTDKQIAQKMHISEATFYKWKSEHSEISESLKRGKDDFDDQIEKTLLQKGLGKVVTTTTTYKMVKVDRDVLNARRVRFLNNYKLDHPKLTKDELKIVAIENVPTYEKIPQIVVVQQLPPDTTSILFWLKNRRPDKWRDRRDVSSGNDELLKANTEKAKAEARIAVHEADQLENDNADNPLVKALYDAVKQNDDEAKKDETDNTKY